MFGTNNTIKVFIGKDINRTGSVQITDPGTTGTYIADGEVLILDSLDAPVTAASEYIKIVQRSGDELHFSPRIKVANIIKPAAKLYAGAAEQVDYVGFTGTGTATITATDYTNYFLNITYKHDKEMWSEQLNKRTYFYQTPKNVTSKMIAANFTRQINADQFAYGGYGAVKAERLIDSTTGTGTFGTATATNGSAYVTLSVGVGVLAVGDVVRIGTNAATVGVYEVKSLVSATVIELDTPFQGTSGAGQTFTGIMTGILYWGIKLTGLPLTYVAKGLKPYKKVFYDLAITNWGATTMTASTRMYPGNGVWQQVSDMEWFALGGDGIRNFMWHPQPTGRTDVVSGANYNVFGFEYTNTDETYVISGTKPAKGLIYIYVVGTHGGGNQMDHLVHTTTGEFNVAAPDYATTEWA